MPSFTLDGEKYDLLENPTLGECMWVERQAGAGFDELKGMGRLAALVLLSVRRKGVSFTWKDIEGVGLADLGLDIEDADPEAEAPDPTSDGAEAVPA